MNQIVVNGRPYNFPQNKISYDEVVALAGKVSGRVYTVTYSSRQGNASLSGNMCPGDVVDVGPNMKLDVAFTGNA